MGWTADTHSNCHADENRDAKIAGNFYAIAANGYTNADGNGHKDADRDTDADGNPDNDAGSNDNAFPLAFANPTSLELPPAKLVELRRGGANGVFPYRARQSGATRHYRLGSDGASARKHQLSHRRMAESAARYLL